MKLILIPLILCLAAVCPGFADTDVTAPAVESLTFTPNTGDVTSGPVTVTVTARFTDVVSGFNYGGADFYSPSGNQRATATFSASERISGTAQDGTYRATFQIPRYAESGVWRVHDIYAFDAVGNYQYYFRPGESTTTYPPAIDQPLTITPLTPIQAWRQQYFGATSNTGNAADTANPDGDGLSNLMEFAFGTDPTVAQTGVIAVSGGTIAQHGTPTTSVTNTATGVDFRAVFGRRKDYVAAGLTYTVQFSGDLITWDSSSATPNVIAEDGTIEAVTVRYPFFVSNGKKARFFRVQIVIAP